MATLVQRSCSCMMAWGVLHQKPSKGPHIPPSCSSRGLCQPVGRGHCLSELEATKAEARQAGTQPECAGSHATAAEAYRTNTKSSAGSDWNFKGS